MPCHVTNNHCLFLAARLLLLDEQCFLLLFSLEVVAPTVVALASVCDGLLVPAAKRCTKSWQLFPDSGGDGGFQLLMQTGLGVCCPKCPVGLEFG